MWNVKCKNLFRHVQSNGQCPTDLSKQKYQSFIKFYLFIDIAVSPYSQK